MKAKIVRHIAAAFTLVAIGLAGSLATSAVARADNAIGWVGDLPVPAAALIVTQSALNFDSPSGRVIRFTFHSELDAAAMADFYQGTLTALGWRAFEDGYVRGDEIMAVSLSADQPSDGGQAYDVIVRPRGE